VTIGFQSLGDTFFFPSCPPSSIGRRNRSRSYRWGATDRRIRPSARPSCCAIFISVDIDIFITINLDIPISLIFDDAGRRFRNVVRCPGFNSLSLTVIYRAWWVERFGIGYDKTKIVLKVYQTGNSEEKVETRTANSSKDLYLDLTIFSDIVPKSIGCFMTSMYPGTFSGSTGLRKKA
jgi:hypothetical protein